MEWENSQRRLSQKTSPKGEEIYGERAIKSLHKDTGAEFSEYSMCLKPVWHRLMMLEGLDEAGGWYEGVESGVSLLALDTSLEANSRSAISLRH